MIISNLAIGEGVFLYTFFHLSFQIQSISLINNKKRLDIFLRKIVEVKINSYFADSYNIT